MKFIDYLLQASGVLRLRLRDEMNPVTLNCPVRPKDVISSRRVEWSIRISLVAFILLRLRRLSSFVHSLRLLLLPLGYSSSARHTHRQLAVSGFRRTIKALTPFLPPKRLPKATNFQLLASTEEAFATALSSRKG